MAEITICSDFGAHKNKVTHCFHCFPIYLPWSNGTGCHDLSFLNVELYPPCYSALSMEPICQLSPKASLPFCHTPNYFFTLPQNINSLSSPQSFSKGFVEEIEEKDGNTHSQEQITETLTIRYLFVVLVCWIWSFPGVLYFRRSQNSSDVNDTL